MAERVMVAIVTRTDTPRALEDVCTICKHFVRLDPEAEQAQPVCLNCARDFEQRHPGTFTDENLAKIPPAEVDLIGYPSSKPA